MNVTMSNQNEYTFSQNNQSKLISNSNAYDRYTYMNITDDAAHTDKGGLNMEEYKSTDLDNRSYLSSCGGLKSNGEISL